MDISSFYNISSGAIRDAVENSSLTDKTKTNGEFAGLFDKAVQNLNTTNSYLSDAENEGILHGNFERFEQRIASRL